MANAVIQATAKRVVQPFRVLRSAVYNPVSGNPAIPIAVLGPEALCPRLTTGLPLSRRMLFLALNMIDDQLDHSQK